jgi:hypothetical protein
VVEELAKEQHKGMLKKLTKGEFDERIIELGIPLGAAGDTTPSTSTGPVVQQQQPTPPQEKSFVGETSEGATIVEEPVVDKFRKPKAQPETSLDELIYAYLTAGRE